MSLDLTRRDRVFIGVIYAIPVAVLLSALVMAFNHAREWADRHSDGPEWEHWAFAATVELPALLGLLLLTLWPKIGGGRKPTVPRLLFGSAAALSMLVQQAYAGSGAAFSERLVAGAPSFAAGIFLEIVFWVMGLVDAARKQAAAEAQEAAVRETRQQLGLGDIEAPPTLTSPPRDGTGHPDMSPQTPDDPPAMSPDIVTPTSASVSPDIRPVMSPDISPAATGHVGVTSPDIPLVKPTAPSGWPWSDLRDIAPDTEAAERVVAQPDVTPAAGQRGVVSPDTGDGDTTSDVTPTPDSSPDDASPDTDAEKMADPRWAEAAEMRRNGATIKAIAAHYGKSERTVTRWKLPEPAATQTVNGHDLTGANR